MSARVSRSWCDVGWEEDQGNKKEGSWQGYGSWPGCRWFFCWFPTPVGCSWCCCLIWRWLCVCRPPAPHVNWCLDFSWRWTDTQQQEHKRVCVTSDSTGGMFSGVLDRRVSCARWDPVMLNVSILYFWDCIRAFSVDWCHVAAKCESTVKSPETFVVLCAAMI